MTALSRRQDGALGIEQLRELGLSDDRVGLLVVQRRLTRRHRGVYVDSLTKLTARGHLLAALLALGPGAYLSRRTALALHGVRSLNLHAIEVTLVAEHTPRHPGLIVHRTTVVPDDEVCVRNGLRCSSPALALLEAAGRETPAELDRLVAELARRRLLDLQRIDAAIRRRRGLAGLPALRAALHRYRPLSAEELSRFEHDVAAWLAEQPDIPPPLRNVRVDGGRWELDFYWPAHRLVVETDGDQYHRTPAELERDRIKDTWLQRHRIRVMRITDFRWVQDRPGIRSDLRSFTAVSPPDDPGELT